jgi:hypothetical protein
MAETVQGGLVYKLRYTPLRDLLRGRLSARLDLRRQIDAAEISVPAKSLIQRLVKATKLWDIEKIAVVDELIAHFADADAAGKSIDAAIAAFGDERTAARLIARAKRRNRGAAWQIFRGVRFLTVALVAFYILLGIVFFAGKPSPRTDSFAILNRRSIQTPLAQRAWPIYRRALLAMPDRNGSLFVGSVQQAPIDAEPGGADWPALVEWLRAHRAAIDLIQQGSEKPVLGYMHGQGVSLEDAAVFPGAPPASGEPLIINAFTGYIRELMIVASVEAADMRLAVAEGNTAAAMRGFHAQLGIADQLQAEPFYVSQIIALSIRRVAVHHADRWIATHPQMLGDDDLQALAHRLAEPDNATDLLRFAASQRIMFNDLIQHM